MGPAMMSLFNFVGALDQEPSQSSAPVESAYSFVDPIPGRGAPANFSFGDHGPRAGASDGFARKLHGAELSPAAAALKPPRVQDKPKIAMRKPSRQDKPRTILNGGQAAAPPSSPPAKRAVDLPGRAPMLGGVQTAAPPPSPPTRRAADFPGREYTLGGGGPKLAVGTNSPPPTKRGMDFPGRAPMGGGQAVAPKLASALAQKLPPPKKLPAVAAPPRAIAAPPSAREEIYVEPKYREDEKCAPAPVCARAAGPSRAARFHATAPAGHLYTSLRVVMCSEPVPRVLRQL